jgi:HlyD family secretion protein
MSDSERKRPDLSVLRRDAEELEMPQRRGRGLGWLITLVVLGATAWAVYAYVPMPFLWPEVETTSVRQVTPTQKSTVLTASGYTYARVRAAVGSKVIGRILELPIEEGDTLKKGQLIAVLDSDTFTADVRQSEAAVLEAQAQSADADRELKRQERLVASGVGIQAELDAAETRRNVVRAQVRNAEARLAASKAQLAYTRVYSPIDGVVIEKNVEVGEMVAPGGFTSQQSTGAIVRLADPTTLEVEADINESYIARLRRGQPAAIRVDAVPGVSYRGQLRQIVPTADRQRAVVQVKVSIDDRDERLVPDMSASVTFLEEGTQAAQLEAKPTVYVARRAVVEEAGRTYVWIVEDGKVARREVTLGEAEGEDRIVLQGIGSGDVVAVPGADPLREGQNVRVKQ